MSDEKKKEVFKIDNVEYAYNELSDNQKYMVSQLVELQNKLTKLDIKADQHKAARKYFLDTLKLSIETETKGDDYDNDATN